MEICNLVPRPPHQTFFFLLRCTIGRRLCSTAETSRLEVVWHHRLCSTAGVCRSREFWQEAVGTSRLTGHQDAQGRESEESPKTPLGNNGTGRHDASRNPCTTASAAPLSMSPAASGWRRSTRRRSTPSPQSTHGREKRCSSPSRANAITWNGVPSS